MTLEKIVDAIPQHPMFRGDAQSGIFAQQLVRATFKEIFRREYPATKWVNGGLISINSSLNPGAKEYSFTELSATGRAEIVADGATDIPFADLEGENTLRTIKTLAIGVHYSRQDIRTAQMQGQFDIATEKAAAAREAHDRQLDDLIRSGDAAAGLHGMVNQPGIVIQPAITGTWAGATAAQIVGDVTAAINSLMIDSDGVETPDTVLLDVASFSRISTLQNSVASDRTVLDYLKTAFPMITRWDWEAGMKNVSATSGPSMLAYRNDPMKVRAIAPMLLMPTPPQQRGLGLEVFFETRFGGVMTPRPRSILRLDGI